MWRRTFAILRALGTGITCMAQVCHQSVSPSQFLYSTQPAAHQAQQLTQPCLTSHSWAGKER